MSNITLKNNENGNAFLTAIVSTQNIEKFLICSLGELLYIGENTCVKLQPPLLFDKQISEN